VPLVAGLVKKLWEGLNSDVSPAFKSLFNQIRAIYNPQLKPFIIGGCIVEWVDVRTNERPWFS